jgi:hypothetical protein
MKKHNLSENDLLVLGRKVMEILDDWPLSDRDRMNLLGFDETIKERYITRFRNGSAPFPAEDEQVERVRHLLGIQRALQETFPLNSRMPGFWINNFQRSLKGIPMSIMLEDGLPGMYRVWRSLDCTANW